MVWGTSKTRQEIVESPIGKGYLVSKMGWGRRFSTYEEAEEYLKTEGLW